MRYQIHCLVSKNGAIIIEIENDCHATVFQCRSAQERFAHVHHVKCDLDQDSFSSVRHHVPVHHFLSVCVAVPRCSLPQRRRLYNSPLQIAVQTTVGRHDQNIQHRSSTRAPQFSTSQSDWDDSDLPNSPCTDVSCCLPAIISRVPHLRIQSCALEINLAAVRTCLNLDSNHRLVYCCHSH